MNGYDSECLFCEMIAGRQPFSKVYEDDFSLALMNQRQVNPGQVLVIPKAHVATIYDLSEEQAGRLFQALVRVANAIRRAFHPEGLTLFQANGEASFQEINHVHLHLIPRRSGDGLVSVYPVLPPIEALSALDQLAERLRAELSLE